MPMIAISTLLVLVMVSKHLTNLLQNDTVTAGGLWILIKLVIAELPFILSEILPISFMLGILLGLGRLYADQEMTVMFACGLSDKQIFKALLTPAIILFCLSQVNQHYLMPKSVMWKHDIKVNEGANSIIELLAPGKFKSFGKNKEVIFAQEITDQTLHNVFIGWPSTEGGQVLKAKTGNVLEDKNAQYLVLKDGYFNKVDSNQNSQIVKFEEYALKLQQLGKKRIKTENVATSAWLWKQENIYYKSKVVVRTSAGVLFFVLMWIAIPMSKTNPRQGRFLKILPAVIFYALYIIVVSRLNSNMAKGHVPMWFNATGLHVMTIVACYVWFYSSITKKVFRG